MNTIEELIEGWKDTPERHQSIHNILCEKTNETPHLKALRDWVEVSIFGFGERSFYWMWKLICDTLPDNFKFLEIGVFRGQTLALIQTLNPTAKIYGVTPLDSTDGHWESDYAADIKLIHDTFNLKQPNIIKGLSTDNEIIQQAMVLPPFDIVYIDGGHTYDVVKQDIQNYSYMVKQGGYLVIDDCCHKYQIPHGMFAGIESVSKAVDEWNQEGFKELFSVVHIRVFKKL
jgi:hypothetical protein